MDAPIKPRRRRRWPYLLLILLLGFAAYTAFVLRWSYSDGERVGILQKLSHKGFVCKTTEGELALYVVAGMSPQIWNFTVRDAKVAQHLNSMLGRAHPAALHPAPGRSEQLLWRHGILRGRAPNWRIGDPPLCPVAPYRPPLAAPRSRPRSAPAPRPKIKNQTGPTPPGPQAWRSCQVPLACVEQVTA